MPPAQALHVLHASESHLVHDAKVSTVTKHDKARRLVASPNFEIIQEVVGIVKKPLNWKEIHKEI